MCSNLASSFRLTSLQVASLLLVWRGGLPPAPTWLLPPSLCEEVACLLLQPGKLLQADQLTGSFSPPCVERWPASCPILASSFRLTSLQVASLLLVWRGGLSSPNLASSFRLTNLQLVPPPLCGELACLWPQPGQLLQTDQLTGSSPLIVGRGGLSSPNLASSLRLTSLQVAYPLLVWRGGLPPAPNWPAPSA